LTLERLDAWAAEPGQSAAEQQQRAKIAGALVDTSFLRFRTLKRIDNLDLGFQEHVTSLPEGLTLRGSLNLYGWASLVKLPAGLSVGGGLDLRRCTTLTHLPADLAVAGDLDLTFCRALVELPSGLSVRGDLRLSHANGLTELPPRLTVGGTLMVRSCGSLTRLPDDIWIGDTLSMFSCNALVGLADGLEVGGSLFLSECPSLTHLPEKLVVAEHLALVPGTSLRQLPTEFIVGGDITLSGCASLRGLPDELSVFGSLNLSGCSSLIQLPAGLRVERSLILSDCTSLRQLPEDLALTGRDGRLRLQNCTSLTRVPDCVLRWALQSHMATFCIDFTGSGVRMADVEAALRPIERANAEAARRLDSERIAQIAHAYASQAEERASRGNPSTRLAAAIDFWRGLAPADPGRNGSPGATAQDLHAGPQQTALLSSFLEKLCGTADYRNLQCRPLLAQRVVGLIDQMAASEDLAALCYERIGEALESCGDRVSWAMNQLELALRVHQAEHKAAPDQALRVLGRSLLRLQVVHLHAAAKVEALGESDPIEVYLCFETRLAEHVNLPIFAGEMLYEASADVTPEDLMAAAQAARKADADPQQVEAFLASWQPWQGLLRRQQAAACSWQGLPPLPQGAQFDGTEVCVLTQQSVADLQAGGGHVAAVQGALGQWGAYDFNSLLQWWAQRGSHPVHLTPLQLVDIYRVDGAVVA
jgi:hypothetical protein